MTPQYKILFKKNSESASTDVTSIYDPYLLDLSLTDSISDDNDSLEMTFHNPSSEVSRPPIGSSYTIHLGYRETGLRNMGTFLLEEYSIRGSKQDGSTIVIKCNSKSEKSTMTEARDASYSQTSIGQIVQDIADRSQYVPRISAYYYTVLVDYEVQQNTKDQAYLRTLAERYNATFKIKEGTLYFKQRSTSVTAEGGTSSKVVASGKTDILDYSMTVTPQADTNAVRVNYKDEDGDNTVFVAKTTDEPGFGITVDKLGHLPFVFSDKAKALEAGKSYLAEQARQGQELELTLIGNPYIEAGVTVVVQDLLKEIDGDWIMNQVTHKIDKSSGYTTSCNTDSGEDASAEEFTEQTDPDPEYPGDPDAEV